MSENYPERISALETQGQQLAQYYADIVRETLYDIDHPNITSITFNYVVSGAVTVTLKDKRNFRVFPNTKEVWTKLAPYHDVAITVENLEKETIPPSILTEAESVITDALRICKQQFGEK